MKILFYSPLQSRSKDTESIMEAFVNAGHEVFLLTQNHAPIYHQACQRLGVRCYSTPKPGTEGWLRKLSQVRYLIRFCKQNKIDVVYAQLEPANLVAVIAQYFVSAKVILTRHHVDAMVTDSTPRAHKVSVLIFRLARNVLVVSNRSRDYMVDVEKIQPGKIFKINLGYNFALWPAVNQAFVKRKKEELRGAFTIIEAARFTASKRVDMVIELLARLRTAGLNCHLIILGKGELEATLKNQAASLSIEPFVHFEGYVDNTLDYIAAADLMVHLSITESSASVVREAGLAGKTVMVCKGVGDFDEYIHDGVNGFVVDFQDPLRDAVATIMSIKDKPELLQEMGERLHKSVIENFSIGPVHEQYEKLNRGAI